jgi:hypothetical protein
MSEFNIIATVGTSEVELVPYPGGSSGTVPNGKTRMIYAIMLSNSATSANTVTFRIYRGGSLEKSFSFNLASPGVFSAVNPKDSPLLAIPSGRTLKAVASAESVDVVLAGYDK